MILSSDGVGGWQGHGTLTILFFSIDIEAFEIEKNFSACFSIWFLNQLSCPLNHLILCLYQQC